MNCNGGPRKAAWTELVVSFDIRAQCSRTNPASAQKQKQKQNKFKRNTCPYFTGSSLRFLMTKALIFLCDLALGQTVAEAVAIPQ